MSLFLLVAQGHKDLPMWNNIYYRGQKHGIHRQPSGREAFPHPPTGGKNVCYLTHILLLFLDS